MSEEGGGGTETSSERGEKVGGESLTAASSAEKAQSEQEATEQVASSTAAEGGTSQERGAEGGTRDEHVSTTGDPQHSSKPSAAAATAEASAKPAATSHQPSQVAPPAGSEAEGTAPRQVIAVSASKGPAAFFNLARKFLVTDEMCDLSALEGAIVSAVDAAHLLERSKLATIVRVQTSYVAVEPKRKKQQAAPPDTASSTAEAAVATHEALAVAAGSGETVRQQAAAAPSRPTLAAKAIPASEPQGVASMPTEPQGAARGKKSGRAKGSPAGGRELRRARIIITVKRTEDYRRWLEENPLQAIIAGDGDDDDDPDASTEGLTRKPPP